MDNLEIKTLRVCRTCMEEIPNIPFFHLDYMQVHTEPTIKQKLSNCIPELDLSNVQNAIICNACVDTINIVYNFKNKCLQSELQIYKYIQHLQYTSDVDLAEVTQFNQLRCGNLKTEFKTEDIELTENFKCEEASTFVSDDTGFIDMDNDTKSTDSNPAIEEDSNTYNNSNTNILQDCIKTQIIDNQDGNVEDLGTTETIYECYTCGHKTKSKFKLILHIRSHTFKLQHLKSKRQFSKHDNLTPNREADMANKQLKCSICEYHCNYRSHLKQHMLIHTDDRPFTCSVCKYKCRKKSGLKRHMQIHTGYKPFRCLVCEYQCIERSNLKLHMQIHTGVKSCRCSVCEYQCIRKGDLKKHMLIHTGDKPFQCSDCEYQCKLKGNLKIHMKVHTDKSFTCSICEYQCKLKSNFKIHMKIHTDNKQFSCSICKYQCKWKSNLKTHMQTHTDDKPFRCSVCEYQCRQKGDLKKHMLIHTGKKPFLCSVCGYQCRQQSNLKIHMQMHTEDKPLACSVYD